MEGQKKIINPQLPRIDNKEEIDCEVYNLEHNLLVMGKSIAKFQDEFAMELCVYEFLSTDNQEDALKATKKAIETLAKLGVMCEMLKDDITTFDQTKQALLGLIGTAMLSGEKRSIWQNFDESIHLRQAELDAEFGSIENNEMITKEEVGVDENSINLY